MYKEVKVTIDRLFFQYIPNEFLKDVYPGIPGEMMSISCSPHYRFLMLYCEIGKDIWKCYNETDYIKLMKYWGRGDKYNRKKIKRFISNYKSVKRNGLRKSIIVLDKPLYKQFFKSGYEIWHGHHRVVICKVLGYQKLLCRIKKRREGLERLRKVE